MNKGIVIILASIFLYSCSSSKNKNVKKPLFELLLTKNDGGANIKFYEIVSEPKELPMLLGDPDLRRKIKKEDIASSNFIILNLGPMPDGNYASVIDRVEETPTAIIVKIKELTIKPMVEVNESTLYPYSVIKINSKKPLLFK